MLVPKVKLRKNSCELSRLIWGHWRLAEWGLTAENLLSNLKQAADLGFTTLDHADIYGGYSCEGMLGEALKLDKSFRSRIQIVTKCGIKLVHQNRPQHKVKSYDTSFEHIVNSVDNSLTAMKTDYIDLLLIHRPDPLLNPEEVAKAFSMLLDSGKVLYFGVSNFSPPQFDLLDSYLGGLLVTNQIECSVLHPAPLWDGTLDHCLARKCAPMFWSPFGGGSLFKPKTKQESAVKDTLERLAKDKGATCAEQIALAFLLQHPASGHPVLGTGKFSRLKDAAESLCIKLSRDEWFQVYESGLGKEVP